MEKEYWGSVDGKDVWCFTLRKDEMEVTVTNYGATLVGIRVPDKENRPLDVLLGYDSLDGYQKGTGSFGAVVGRCANRIHGDVTLNGVTYPLTKNEGENVLHCGAFSTAHQVWEVDEEQSDATCLCMHLLDKQQAGGLPGNVAFTARYALLSKGTVALTVEGVSDAMTILNVTNHGYFNLAGHASGKITGQEVRIVAENYTPPRADTNTPTGEIRPVNDSVFDFRAMRKIGDTIYDHNYCLDEPEELAAEAFCKESGIHMSMRTNCPCMQFYTGNWIEEQDGKEGAKYGPLHGFCFEPQYAPDAVHLEGLAKPVFDKKEPYRFQMVLQFDKTLEKEKNNE
ncbi:MAG: galactose mutarotase [Lachnospiraceae bacterium]|jgi:aldose 1-epimerase|nr:galactose mutarotase [Lachnospiraceae bacterium]